MTPSNSQAVRARYIRTIVAYHGHTQTDLGQLLGITQVAAGRKLRGLRKFTDDELLTIADFYGVDPANMLRPPDLDGFLGKIGVPATLAAAGGGMSLETALGTGAGSHLRPGFTTMDEGLSALVRGTIRKPHLGGRRRVKPVHRRRTAVRSRAGCRPSKQFATCGRRERTVFFPERRPH